MKLSAFLPLNNNMTPMFNNVPARKSLRRNALRRSSSLEPLESRIAPAVTTAISPQGVLTVSLDAAGDTAVVTSVTGTSVQISSPQLAGSPLTFSDISQLVVSFGSQSQGVTVNDSAAQFAFANGFLVNGASGTNGAITDVTGGNAFDFSGFAGHGSLINSAAATDTLVATKVGNMSLSDTLFTAADGANLLLTNVGVANLKDTGGGNTFTLTGWTGNGSLSGPTAGTADIVTDSENASYTLSDTTLIRTLPAQKQGPSFLQPLSPFVTSTMALSNIGTANLTDTGGNHVFDISGWHGHGSLIGTADNSDTLADSDNANFTLSNPTLSRTFPGTAFPTSTISLVHIGHANLTNTAAGNSFNITGWTGNGTLTGTGAGDTVIDSEIANFTLSDTSLVRDAGGLLGSFDLVKITTANLTGQILGNTFDVSDWTGGGSLTGSQGGNTVIASKDFGFGLSDTSLTSGDGLNMTLSGIGNAQLTDTTGGHTFALSHWSGAGTFSAPFSPDTLSDAEDANFTLTNSSLARSGLQTLTLQNITIVNLTDSGTVGGHTFTISGWTGNGSLTGSATGALDIVTDVDSTSYTLSDSSLVRAFPGQQQEQPPLQQPLPLVTSTMALSHIGTANLTDTGGNNTFDISGWHGQGSLIGTADNSDLLVDADAANFVLSDSSLVRTFPGTAFPTSTISLIHIGDADLTDTAGGNSFTITGWTFPASLTGSGAGDTVVDTELVNFTLTNSTLSRVGLPDIDLTNIVAANLTALTGAVTFDVSGWTHGGVLTGTGTNSIIASKSAGFGLGDTSLTATDGLSMTLALIGDAKLTDTTGGHTFALSHWSGTALLTGSGAGDAVTDSEDANFVLTNSTITRSGLGLVTMVNHTSVGLTDTGGNHTFTITGYTGAGSLADTAAAGDKVIDSEDLSFVLADGSLTRGALPAITLSHITAADLTGQSGGDSFTVGGWTGSGSLQGAGSNTVNATKSADFGLSNALLTASDGMSLTLSGISNAVLVDTGGAHTFTVTGWSGSGSLTDTAATPDTVADTENLSFILTNSTLGRLGLPDLALTNIHTANLTATAAADSFTVDGWTFGGTLTGVGGNLVNATKNADFTLADNSLATTDGMSLGLQGIGVANLTSASASHTFNVSGWSGTGSLNGAGGNADDVIASNDADFTLSDSSLARSGRGTLALQNMELADLTSTTQDHSFTVSGWSGGGSLHGDGGSADTVIAANSVNFVLSDSALTRSATIALSGIEVANLTDLGAGGTHSFDVSGWTGSGTMTGAVGNGDTIVSNKNADAVLTNTILYASDGMHLGLVSIPNASLGAGDDTVNHTLNARSFGSGATGNHLTLTGGGGNDTLIAGLGTNLLKGGVLADRFVLSGHSVSDTLVTSQYGEMDAKAQLAHQPPVKVNGIEQRDLIDYGNDSQGAGVTVDLRKASQNVLTPKSPGATGNLILQNADGTFGLFADLIGSQYADKLTGNALSNVIYYGGGKKTVDTLAGGGVPAKGLHDFLVGNKKTKFVAPTPGSGAINSLFRSGVPFLVVTPVVVPGPIYDAIVASGDANDPYITRGSGGGGGEQPPPEIIPVTLLTRHLAS